RSAAEKSGRKRNDDRPARAGRRVRIGVHRRLSPLSPDERERGSFVSTVRWRRLDGEARRTARQSGREGRERGPERRRRGENGERQEDEGEREDRGGRRGDVVPEARETGGVFHDRAGRPGDAAAAPRGRVDDEDLAGIARAVGDEVREGIEMVVRR